ncbi:MAG: HAD family hydrolase [Myxococcota bacterium]
MLALDGVVLDVLPARAEAVARALRAYPAIEAPAPDPARLTRTLEGDGGGDEYALASRLLRAAAGGVDPGAPEDDLPPRATVDEAMLGRLLDEALLGDVLFEVVHGEAPREPLGQGTLGAVRRVVSVETLERRAAGGPLALVSHRPGPEVLYLLLEHGLGDVFAAVVTGDGEAERRALFAEARRRVGAEVAWVRTAADRRAAEAAGLATEAPPW